MPPHREVWECRRCDLVHARLVCPTCLWRCRYVGRAATPFLCLLCRGSGVLGPAWDPTVRAACPRCWGTGRALAPPDARA